MTFMMENGATFVRHAFKLFAYCARYGHQGLNVLMSLTMRDLLLFQESLSELVKDEADSVQESAMSGG